MPRMPGSKDQFNAQRPGDRLGDAPVQAEYHQKMVATMAAIDELFNGSLKAPDKTVGVVLMVFPYGDEASGRCNYMSNGANRNDIVSLMKEMIRRFEGGADMKPGNA